MEGGNKKTKILYVITKGNFGGAQRYVFDLATHLPKDLYEAVVVYGNGEALRTKLDSYGIRTRSIESLIRNISILKELQTITSLISIINDENPDVIHLNSSKAGILGAVAGTIIKVSRRLSKNSKSLRIIFTGHGWAFNEDRNLLSKTVVALGHYVTIILSDTVIAVSQQVQKQISRFPFTKQKIVMIHNGISQIQFESKESARKSLGIPENSFVFGTLSELHKNKGIDIALRSFVSIARRYPDVLYVILGNGEEKNTLIQLTKSLRIEESVRFLGYIDHASTYLKAFDVFTLTSRTEAFPYVILEAGNAGLPIIASRVGGIPEVITNKQNGLLVEPKNTFDLEYSMHELIRDERQRKALGKSLEETLNERFTLHSMLEKTVALYKD